MEYFIQTCKEFRQFYYHNIPLMKNIAYKTPYATVIKRLFYLFKTVKKSDTHIFRL